MAVNKNFVVKNGLEVNQDLILADAFTNRVGIGSTIPQFELDVLGGIGASFAYVSAAATITVGVVTNLQGSYLNFSGVSTITSLRGSTAEYDTFYGDVGIITSFNTSGIGTIETKLNVGAGGTVLTAFVNAGVGSVGIATANPEYLLDIRSPVSTGVTALYVQGDVRITGDINVDDITFDQATVSYLNVTGFSTVADIFVAGVGSITSYVGLITNLTGTNINYGGIGTIANLGGSNISYSGVGTINTLYGDSAEFNNIYADVGIVTTLTGIDVNYTGVGTINTLYGNGAEFNNIYADVGIVTTLSGTNLNYTGVGTINTLYGDGAEFNTIYADVGIITSVTSTDINVTGIATINTVSIAGAALSSLYVSGISTLGTVQISSGVITATTGIVTYYGDGSNLTGIATGLTAAIGVGSESTFVGAGITEIYFATTTGTNVNVVAAGTSATVTITPGVSLGLAIALGG